MTPGISDPFSTPDDWKFTPQEVIGSQIALVISLITSTDNYFATVSAYYFKSINHELQYRVQLQQYYSSKHHTHLFNIAYYLQLLFEGERFKVLVDNEVREGKEMVSWTKRVIIEVYYRTVVLLKNQSILVCSGI